METKPKTPPPNLDASADYSGKTHELDSNKQKRLLELKGELERASGGDRARIQSAIDRLREG